MGCVLFCAFFGICVYTVLSCFVVGVELTTQISTLVRVGEGVGLTEGWCGHPCFCSNTGRRAKIRYDLRCLVQISLDNVVFLYGELVNCTEWKGGWGRPQK